MNEQIVFVSTNMQANNYPTFTRQKLLTVFYGN